MPDDDDLPVFRPRFGKAPRKRSSQGFRNALLAAMVAAGVRRRRLTAAGRRNVRVAVERPGAGARRVIVKARFVKTTRYGAKAAALHLRYIERDGVEKDGSKGVLYGPDGTARAEPFEEPRAGEKWQYRLIVSPEDAAELDLSAYIRRLMARVEKDLGQPIEWAAVNHYDTDHPHAHVIVRGVDGRGHEVRFDRAYMSQGLRWRAQELATWELGPRTELDAQRARSREVEQERFTSLDRELERRAQAGIVDLGVAPSGRAKGASALLARLHHLEALGLAERRSAASWALADEWATELRERAVRGDIIKQMHAALRGDPSRYRIIPPGEGIEPTPTEPWAVLHGRVVAKGLSDELAGRYYAVIETPSGSGYHLPLDARAAEGLRVGDLVSFGGRSDTDHRASPVPRARIVVRKEALAIEEQVLHRGPVLLDQLADRPLAPYGFGHEVRRAAERRARVLRDLCIDPLAPDRFEKLCEIERRGIAERFAARSGQAFVSEPPESFEGRVQLVERGGDGATYAAVSDGTRFAMMRGGRELTQQQGKFVAVRRDADGKLQVRDPGVDRER